MTLVIDIDQIVIYGVVINTIGGLGATYANDQWVQRVREQQRIELAKRDEVRYNNQIQKINPKKELLKKLDLVAKSNQVETLLDGNCTISMRNIRCI